MRGQCWIVTALVCLLLAACGNINNINVLPNEAAEAVEPGMTEQIFIAETDAEPAEQRDLHQEGGCQRPRDELAMLDTKAITSVSEYEAAEYPVLAAVPERDYYLYTDKISDGLFLRAGESDFWLEELYVPGPRFVLPRMEINDYDGDGLEELAIIWHQGGGTGVSIDGLIVAGLADDPICSRRAFENYVEQLESVVRLDTRIESGKLTGELSVDGQLHTVDLSEFQDETFGALHDRVLFGNITQFEFKEGKIAAQFGVGLGFENVVTPQYIGMVSAQVDYRAGEFGLSRLRFEAYDSYVIE